ncbi:hypothetical protein R1sor_018607 [Riccia sorocarpa]|uniref:Uncharacterized protein n=1 Tax=Riccia sorocarpa TaxID=122646 RepID=A0ABD3IDR3_9MARC
MLTDKLDTFYYCSSELKQQGHVCNRIVVSLVVAAIRKARDILVIDSISCASENDTKVTLVKVRLALLVYMTSVLGTLTSVDAHAGYSEVKILRMLGTKWMIDVKGLANVTPADTLGSIEVANLGLPVR